MGAKSQAFEILFKRSVYVCFRIRTSVAKPGMGMIVGKNHFFAAKVRKNSEGRGLNSELIWKADSPGEEKENKVIFI